MTDYKEIAKKDDKELIAFINEKREEVRKFRFGTAGAGTRNIRAVRNAKLDIARAMTEQTKRSKSNNTNSKV